jgi:TolA-binding protein
MASGANLEQVSIEEAVKRLVEVDKTNSNKISRLETQIDEICRNFEEYREQSTNSTKEELRNMSERISEIQSANAAFQQETNHKFEEIKYQWHQIHTDIKSDMNAILIRLSETSGPTISTATLMPKEETRTKEDFKENTAVRTTQEPASHFKHEKNKFKD